MLERLGGRAAWAGLRNTINGSQQNRAGEPTVVYAVITMDFERPRFRIETTAQDLRLIRVIDGDNSWRLRRSGAIEDVPAELYADDMRWYEAHLYRTIHRVAARDPALQHRRSSKADSVVTPGRMQRRVDKAPSGQAGPPSILSSRASSPYTAVRYASPPPRSA